VVTDDGKKLYVHHRWFFTSTRRQR